MATPLSRPCATRWREAEAYTIATRLGAAPLQHALERFAERAGLDLAPLAATS
jgi:hypothetical protein